MFGCFSRQLERNFGKYGRELLAWALLLVGVS